MVNVSVEFPLIFSTQEIIIKDFVDIIFTRLAVRYSDFLAKQNKIILV